MSKTAILMLGAAFLVAGATISTSTAEARGLRFGLGVGLGLGAAALFHHRHRHHHGLRHRHRPHSSVIVTPAPRYTRPQPYKTARPVPVVPQAASTVRYADGMARVYDPGSGIWHDGQNRCWAGKYQWTFKNGVWFYGAHSWFPANGTWQTEAPEPPSPIDCRSSPAFASGSGGSVEGAGYTAQGEPAEPRAVPAPTPAPLKAADKVEAAGPRSTTGDGTCKKYLPSIGQTMSVPCTN